MKNHEFHMFFGQGRFVRLYFWIVILHGTMIDNVYSKKIKIIDYFGMKLLHI